MNNPDSILITGVYVRKDGLYLLYSGEDAVALLDYKAVEQGGIKKGCVISGEALSELIYQSDCRRCKAKALDLLSRRDYCQKELINRLSCDFDRDAAEAAVDYCARMRYIDDYRYAQNAAISLITHRSFSPFRAVRELKAKGVPADTAQSAVDSALELIDYDEGDGIYAVIDKKYSGIVNDEKTERRCFNALIRLGYTRHDIIDAIEQYKFDHDCCDY